ncbi:MAG: PhoPQ-activated protein PqaA family protein, partial [Chromatiales bacterium]
MQSGPPSAPSRPGPPRRFPAGLGALCLLWGLISCTGAFALSDPATALEEYVGTPDPAYGVVQEESRAEDGYTLHRLKVISQGWRSPGEVDPVQWRHWMVVVVPDRVQGRTAFLI